MTERIRLGTLVSPATFRHPSVLARMAVTVVAERIEGLRTLGVTRVFLQHLNHSDDEMVALIDRRLLPALR
jgi:hypothetical protein